MYRNINFAAQTLTDAGVIYFDPQQLVKETDGTLYFVATGTKTTGTFSASAQLQGSTKKDFSKNVVNIGSPVVMADTVPAIVSETVNALNQFYYRLEITGSGTQSTEVEVTFAAKDREV